MLKIYLGNMEKAIYHPPTYFDNQYEDEWITKELSIRMIKDTLTADSYCFYSKIRLSVPRCRFLCH